MKKSILKHMHRPIGISAFLCLIGKLNKDEYDYTTFSKTIMFKENCAYNLDCEDQYDWNKLFGVCFGITGIHKCSLRFGWRYNINKDLIEISTIVYSKGIPSRIHLTDVEVNKDYEYKIQLYHYQGGYDLEDGYSVTFYVIENGVTIAKRTVLIPIYKKWYFGCGFYFGGNKRAPHKMSININK